MNIEQVKQFIKEVRWGFLTTTDGRKVGVSGYGGLRPNERPMTNSPAPLFLCSSVLFCPASPDYVVLKMTPDNIRFMESTDMAYKQVEVK